MTKALKLRSSEIVFNMVLTDFLDDDSILAYSYEYFITDTHASNRELVLVQIEVNIVVVTTLVLCPARTELFLSGHCDMLSRA